MDAGRALLEVESALEAAGCLRPEWKLHWQPQWRARLSHCYDMRDALLCCAALEVSSKTWHVSQKLYQEGVLFVYQKGAAAVMGSGGGALYSFSLPGRK